MSLRRETPCDFGPCPYNAEYYNTCEYYCGADEPYDEPEEFDYDFADTYCEIGFNPYMGCYDWDE